MRWFEEDNDRRLNRVSRNLGLSHIIRQADGTSVGVWGLFTLRTAFQPILAFTDGQLSVVAYEGLARPFRDGESVEPDVFFSSLPEADRFHVETLTRTLHLLNAGTRLESRTSIFVNFDPSLFKEKKIAERALRDMRLVLHEADIDPARVVCEVIEKKSHSTDALQDFVQALRAHGFRIAVDDYGAESSDFRRIKELSPDIVKFDAQWITHLMESGPGLTLLTAMVDEFSAKGIKTVFEGIEEAWQLELAEKSGASMVQGFAVARPELVAGDTVHFGTGTSSDKREGPVEGHATDRRSSSSELPSTPRPFGRRS